MDMRKPVFPRILILLLLYAGVFMSLVTIQFAKQNTFTHKVGNLMVSGQYRAQSEHDSELLPNEHFLEGDAYVTFGGMEFCIGSGNDGRSFRFTGQDGASQKVLAERLIISDDSIHFVLAEGMELSFTGHNTGGAPELRVSAVFLDEPAGLELPFRPQRGARLQPTGEDHFIVISGGLNYTFGPSLIDAVRRVALLEAGGKPVIYGAIPEQKTLSPFDFIIPQAETTTAYNEAIRRWRDQNYTRWNRTVSQHNNEDIVVALIGEAINRNAYSASVASIPETFLRGSSRTYVSSVFLGDLNQAYRSLSTIERDKLSRLTRQINEKSLEFLLEPRVLEYFAVRGQPNLIDSGADLVRTINQEIMAQDIIPGIFEGYSAFRTIRPAAVNPFEQLVDQACHVILNSLRVTDEEGVALTFGEDSPGAEFNLRLGKALIVYGETMNDSSWAGLGRSLVLSALTEEAQNTSTPELTNARLYRTLSPVDSYPRAIVIANNVWAWTTAQAVSTTTQNDMLDISVSFPAGETHYMIIRGMRPFARLQLYNMDFRTDPQFERYDSSGWSYISQEQTLIVKMKHRDTVEHIRIFGWSP